jgi:MGT family glycosyltransferase
VTPTTVAFLPEVGAWGPTLNCVALAEVLRERGARCVFVVDESFAGLLAAKGFDEVLLRVADPPAADDGGADGWAEYVRVTAPEFRKPTIEQVATVVRPIWETLVAQGRYAHERLVEVWREQAPDVIVTDNVSAFPSILTSGVPWVRAVSCNELELQDPALPPIFSGYAEAGGDDWDAFRAEYRRACGPVFDEFDAFCQEAGAPPLPPLEFAYTSPYLNLFLFPREVTYARRSRPPGPEWQRLDSTVRAPDRPFHVDEHLPGDGALLYLSLGSLGSMDVGLMQRIVDVLAATPHRVIVSLGPLGDQVRLGERMYGEEFLPQTAIVPQCDLLITHGGNNTFCEALHFGVPMIALPLFWDQYDNAQRAADCGVGERLPTYAFAPDELTGAIDRLLADDALRARLRRMAERIQAAPGQVRAADLIGGLVGATRT